MKRLFRVLVPTCALLWTNLAVSSAAIAGPSQRPKANAPKNHYQVLGVRRNATPTKIREAYRRAAAAVHPDKHAGDATKTAEFQAVVAAWEVLSNPEARATYDDELPAPRAQAGFNAATRGPRRVGSLAETSHGVGVATMIRVMQTGSTGGSVSIAAPADDAALDVAEQELTQLGIKLTNRTYVTHFDGRGPQVKWRYAIDVKHPGGLQISSMGRPAAQAFTKRVTTALAGLARGPGEITLPVSEDALDEMSALVNDYVAPRLKQRGLGQITGITLGQGTFTGAYVKLQVNKR